MEAHWLAKRHRHQHRTVPALEEVDRLALPEGARRLLVRAAVAAVAEHAELEGTRVPALRRDPRGLGLGLLHAVGEAVVLGAVGVDLVELRLRLVLVLREQDDRPAARPPGARPGAGG